MAIAYTPVAETSTAELLEGETVLVGGNPSFMVPINPTRANDVGGSGASHFSLSMSERPSFANGGAMDYWWAVDFGSAHTVERFRIWPGGPGWDTGYQWTNTIEWSNDGTSWTSTAFTLTSQTVPTGNVNPYPEFITEYVYAINSPSSHRYWRIRKSGSFGLQFFNGDGMVSWYIDGSTVVTGDVVWESAPATIDDDDGTYVDVAADVIVGTDGPFWRATLSGTQILSGISALIGFENTGSVTLLLQGATESDYSDAETVAILNTTATGSLTDDELGVVFDDTQYEFWQLVIDSGAQDVRVYEVFLDELPAGPGPVVPPGHEPSKAILEIYVHDEDASKWGIATWATGPATGTEGIWSGAGWQNVTPEGVNVHVIWGSRRPERGILAGQTGASWNVETYDPERILDPGNFDSPYYPQLLPGVPIRVSHESLVIRTGYIDEMTYKHKRPDYQGQILGSDTIALLNQAQVPSDSILGDTLLERVQDAINAAGIAIGGIPIPPGGPAGPAIAPLDTDNPRERSVWDHVQMAADEVLWVVYVDAAAGLGMRAWGAPLDRSREISAPNLEDLAAKVSEDGMYSVARVQGDDPDVDPIEREAAPLPRYGRRVIERTELTLDPEAWADAVLADRAWAGVQYIPGTIHCFTKADVDYFGSIEIMELVTVTLPGDVSVTGRVLGGELFVEHKAGSTRGAKWQFLFAIATDGSSAIGLTTLVADGTGDTLLDDVSGVDYLEAD